MVIAPRNQFDHRVDGSIIFVLKDQRVRPIRALVPLFMCVGADQCVNLAAGVDKKTLPIRGGVALERANGELNNRFLPEQDP